MAKQSGTGSHHDTGSDTMVYYILFSGGVDSTVAFVKTLSNTVGSVFTPVFIDYGQKASEMECKAVHAIASRLRQRASTRNHQVTEPIVVQAADCFPNSKSSILKGNSDKPESPDIEGRNRQLILLAVEAIQSARMTTRPTRLITGFKNEFDDTTSQFVAEMNALLATMDPTSPIVVVAPLITFRGHRELGSGWAAAVARDMDHAGYADLIDLTWSCYYPTPQRVQCGNCGPCDLRRLVRNSIRHRSTRL